MVALGRLLAVAAAAFLFGLHAASPAQADDVSFGADALRRLSEDSEAIVTANEPRRLETDPAKSGIDDPERSLYALYAVKVESVLKGALDAGQEIRVAFPESLNIRRIEDLSDSILFLRRFSQEDVKLTNLPDSGETFIAVSGRHGAVSGADPNRKVAVSEYIGAMRPEAASGERVLGWTERHINSKDPFIQRSAVIDLYFERKQPEAVRQLGNAVRSEAVLPGNKITAIEALETTKSPAAVAPLREIAEDQRVPAKVRQSAVKAFQSLPGGEEVLRNWRDGADRTLAPAAKSTIERLERQ